MAKPLLKDALSFEFDTNAGRKLELFGELLGWEDELKSELVEHRVLRRDGARHQNMGAAPRRYTFQCVVMGRDVQSRYQSLADDLAESPAGSLIHPRFGHRAAVWDSMSARETPGDAIDTIYYTIKFSDDDLRTPPPVSAATAASRAADSAAQLVVLSNTLVALPPALKQSALAFQQLALTLQAAVGDVAVGAVPVPELAFKLSDLRTAALGIDRLVPEVGNYSLRAAAHLSYARALAAYNAIRAGRPPILEHLVQSPTSVARLCADLYGGRFARPMAIEVKQFNRIADPLRIPDGRILLLSDPAVVTRNAG